MRGTTCFVLVLDGVADGPVGLTLDVLGATARLAGGGTPTLRARLVSPGGRPVRTAAGRALAVDGALRGMRPARRDVLLVPGLGAATPALVDALLAREDVAQAMQAIRRAHAAGAIVAASCSATYLLAASGILTGRAATTTWWLAQDFARRYPDVELRSDRMVVASGRIVTAGSAFAHADLALALVARSSGPELAALASRYLVLDERPSQARYMILEHLRTDSPDVRALERFVLANLGRRLSLAAMAKAAKTSPRTLARRVASALGTTPQRFARRLRIERAVHLLQTTTRAVEDVANAVGWEEPAAFRRALRAETGASPAELRRGGGRRA